MLFFPFRVDLNFNRIPLLTILVCVVCLYIFIQQGNSFEDIQTATSDFCEQEHERMFWIIIKKVSLVKDSESIESGKKISEVFKDECKDIYWNVFHKKYPYIHL